MTKRLTSTCHLSPPPVRQACLILPTILTKRRTEIRSAIQRRKRKVRNWFSWLKTQTLKAGLRHPTPTPKSLRSRRQWSTKTTKRRGRWSSNSLEASLASSWIQNVAVTNKRSPKRTNLTKIWITTKRAKRPDTLLLAVFWIWWLSRTLY